MARKTAPPKEAIEIKKNLILEHWSDQDSKKPVELSKLPLDVVLTVFSMMSRGANAEGDSILPPADYIHDLLPNTEKVGKLISKSFQSNALIVDTFKCTTDDFTDDGVSFYTLKVHFKPNISWGDIPIETVRNPIKARELLHELFMKKCWYENWTEEFYELWLNIALAECLEYANNRADYYNFRRDEINLEELCKPLLQNYSVSNIYSMISTAFHNAAAFQKTDKCTSFRHALNTIPGKISSLASKPANQVREWDRINELPRCELSLTLFNKILGYSEDIGFYRCPSKEYFAIAEQRLEHFPQGRHSFFETSDKQFFLLKFVLSTDSFSEFDKAVINSYEGFNLVGDLQLDEDTKTFTATATYDDWYAFDEVAFVQNIANYYGYTWDVESIADLNRSEVITLISSVIIKGRKCPKNVKEAMKTLLSVVAPMWDDIYKFIRSANNESNILGVVDCKSNVGEFESISATSLYANSYKVHLPFALIHWNISKLNKLCIAANTNIDAFAQEYASNLIDSFDNRELANKVAEYFNQGLGAIKLSESKSDA